jgi:hypothetical protein
VRDTGRDDRSLHRGGRRGTRPERTRVERRQEGYTTGRNECGRDAPSGARARLGSALVLHRSKRVVLLRASGELTLAHERSLGGLSFHLTALPTRRRACRPGRHL